MPPVKAADPVYFTGIDSRLLKLSGPMPKYVGDTLYLPYTTFSTGELGIYAAPSTNLNTILIYSSATKSLKFDVATGITYDQDGTTIYRAAVASNGTVYLPAKFVCDYFGLLLSVVQASPAPIVRIKTTPYAVNDATFIGLYKNDMQAYYDAYFSSDSSTSAPTSSDPSGDPTYERVTLYLSFYSFTQGKMKSLLDAMDSTPYKCLLLVTADEIAANADQLRRAVCSGHTIGIWLNSGEYDEYQTASSLLFEAAKVKTKLVSSGGDIRKAAEKMTAANSLIYWQPTRFYDESAKVSLTAITSRLSVVSGSRESLCFAFTDKTASVIRSTLSYLSQKKYTIRRITETSTPTVPLS